MTQNAQNTAAALRKRLKQARSDMEARERSRGALLMRGRLFTWLATNRTQLREAGRPDRLHIAAFWSLPAEPEIQPLLYQWADDETLSLSLPVVTGPDDVLSFRLWTPDTPMQPGAYGIEEPQGPAAPPPDIMLIPTLGYTRQGDRLGYGGGYYDRTLAALAQTGKPLVRLGLAWASGDLSESGYVPQAHDVCMDSILTDKGWAVPAVSLVK